MDLADLFTCLVFSVFYALSPAEASRLFNLNKTGAGWINRPGSSWIELAFTAYYMIYHVLSTILIIVWGIRTADKAIRSQSKLLTLSLLFAMIFGNMFDRYYHTDLTGPELPQLAPVFILMPMVSAYYAIRHFGFLGNDVINEDEMIMNSRSRLDIYSKLAAFLAVFGFISLPVQYIVAVRPGYNSVAEMLYSSSLFFSIALLVYLINKLKFFDGVREPLFAMAQAVIIPIVILRYADIASVTVWAVPVIPILMAVLLNSYFALTVVTVSSLMSIVLVMIGTPELIVSIDVADHIARLVIMLIIVIGAIQVNRLYLSRLKQNADQIQLQKQISEMTNLMLDVSADNLEQRMTHMLRSSARFLGSDSGAVYYNEIDSKKTIRAFSWYETEHDVFDDDQREVSEDAYKWTNRKLLADGILIIRGIDDIPEEEHLMRDYFQNFGIKSLIIKQLGDKDNVIGDITFSSTEETMVWDEGQLEFVNILSNIAFSAIERVNREQTIQSLAYYDRLTGLVNRSRFLELAGMRLEQATADNRQLAIAFMDLDAFKAVNDSIGHDGGDELLKRLATQMQSVIRESDMLGRFGGDEFLLLLDPVDNEQHALDLLSPIIAIFQEPFKLRGNRYQVTVSAGLALFPRDGEDLDTLIQNADLAMYEAKILQKSSLLLQREPQGLKLQTGSASQ
jgi:diguanylate cyclase (GGDEF)-like protein